MIISTLKKNKCRVRERVKGILGGWELGEGSVHILMQPGDDFTEEVTFD